MEGADSIETKVRKSSDLVPIHRRDPFLAAIGIHRERQLYRKARLGR
jgi:hypothetical protein